MAYAQIVSAKKKMRTKMKNNSQRSLLLGITAIFISLSLFTAILFETNHKGHEAHCHEDNCPVCFLLQIIHNTNKQTAPIQLISVKFSAFYYINLFVISALLLVPATLVKQKIKLVI